MLTATGPRLVEFNARFGDPECQVVVPGLRGDFAAFLLSAAEGRLDAAPRRAGADTAAVTVVIGSDEPAGGVVSGVADADALDDVSVYHARTAAHGDQLVTAGPGRVLSVTGRGRDVAAARERAYAGVTCITLPGMYARTDIAVHVKEKRS